MSARARSILISRKGRLQRRRCLIGSKNRMMPIWLEPAGSSLSSGCTPVPAYRAAPRAGARIIRTGTAPLARCQAFRANSTCYQPEIGAAVSDLRGEAHLGFGHLPLHRDVHGSARLTDGTG